MMSYCAALFTVIGLLLAKHKHRACWIFFLIGNCFWIGFGVHSKIWAIVATDSLMLLINFSAWRKWK